MKYHTLFFLKIRKNVTKFSSAAVVIGALRLNVSYFDLFQNSVSMIAEIARSLPRASEKPEKILDQLFEPLLGKNVMR